MLFHLIYVSRAVPTLQSTDLDDILTASRARNASLGITGMLLFADDSFIQVLEGDKTAVEEVFVSIERDKRHQDVTALVREAIKDRYFPDWSMGFERIEDVSQVGVGDTFVINGATLRERLRAAPHDVKSFIYGFVEIRGR